MADIQLNPPKQLVERNIALTSEVMRNLMAQPQALAQLPDEFELVVLPENDPEMWLYNLGLMRQADQAGIPLVLALLGETPTAIGDKTAARFYVPVVG